MLNKNIVPMLSSLFNPRLPWIDKRSAIVGAVPADAATA